MCKLTGVVGMVTVCHYIAIYVKGKALPPVLSTRPKAEMSDIAQGEKRGEAMLYIIKIFHYNTLKLVIKLTMVNQTTLQTLFIMSKAISFTETSSRRVILPRVAIFLMLPVL